VRFQAAARRVSGRATIALGHIRVQGGAGAKWRHWKQALLTARARQSLQGLPSIGRETVLIENHWFARLEAIG